MAGINVSNLH